MAEVSDVRKEPAIVWTTNKETICNQDGWSSVFTLFGATWRLKMTETMPHNHYYPYHHAVSLRRIGNTKPNTPFTVVTTIQSTGILPVESNHTKCIKAEIFEAEDTILWQCHTNVAYAEYAERGEVTVFCIFTDIPCATSGVLNATGYKLYLEGCELQASYISCDLDSLSGDLSKLLENKVLPDINLNCGGRKVAAHKAILAARSVVFSAMFQSNMLESETGEVDITDIDAPVLESFLKYVYTGKLLLLSDESLPSMYAAADKYAISSLKQACAERMIKHLTQENCFNLLLLADTHSDQNFKNALLDFISENIEILKSQEWTKFRDENLRLSRDVVEAILQKKCFS